MELWWMTSWDCWNGSGLVRPRKSVFHSFFLGVTTCKTVYLIAYLLYLCTVYEICRCNAIIASLFISDIIIHLVTIKLRCLGCASLIYGGLWASTTGLSTNSVDWCSVYHCNVFHQQMRSFVLFVLYPASLIKTPKTKWFYHAKAKKMIQLAILYCAVSGYPKNILYW